MQVLEWALLYPEKVRAIAPMASPGRHSAWSIGLSEAQRQAIYSDRNWQSGNYTTDTPPVQGLAVATQQTSVNVGFPNVKRHSPQAGKPVQGDGSPTYLI
jgi:homoserine O-acetyltransferase